MSKRTGNLRYKEDIYTIATITGYYIFLAFSWYIFPYLAWYWILLLIAANCFYEFIITTITHNVVHVPVFRKKSWNKVFQLYLSLANGYPVSGFVPGHNLSHHEHLQTPKDAARTTRARFKWNLLNQLLFFFLLAGDIQRSERKFVKKMWRVKPGWSRQYLVETVLVFSSKLILLLIDWPRALLLVIIPHFYSTWGIFGTNYWQHDGCDENHPYNHSRNFTGKLFNWLTFNNGYHAAHHMKPGLHWSLYPKYHETHVKPHLHPSLDQKSLLVYLWKTCVYPAKRVDYLGNPIQLPSKQASEDWVDDVPDTPESRIALGSIQ